MSDLKSEVFLQKKEALAQSVPNPRLEPLPIDQSCPQLACYLLLWTVLEPVVCPHVDVDSSSLVVTPVDRDTVIRMRTSAKGTNIIK